MGARYEQAAEVARGALGALSIGRALRGERAGLAAWLRRLSAAPPWENDQLDALHDAEKQALGIHHPSILGVVDVERTASDLLVATEYVEGVPLDLVMLRARESTRKPPVEAAVRVAESVARAVAGAEEALGSSARPNVPAAPISGVHPECIVLTTGDDALIADLGLVTFNARVEHPSLVAYRAPEILGRGAVASEAAWVYAIGLILWELIAGRDVFGQRAREATVDTVRAQALAGNIARLDAAAGRPVPPLVVELVMQSIGREPGARFPNVRAFADALAAVGGRQRQGTITRLLEQIGGDLLETQRRTLAASEKILSSLKPTLRRPARANGAPPSPPARRIGLAAYVPPKAREPEVVEPRLDRPSPIEQPPPGVKSTADVQSVASIPVGLLKAEHVPPATKAVRSDAVPAQARSALPYRAPAPTAPLLLVHRVGDSAPPAPARRWGRWLVMFVLLVALGATAVVFKLRRPDRREAAEQTALPAADVAAGSDAPAAVSTEATVEEPLLPSGVHAEARGQHAEREGRSARRRRDKDEGRATAESVRHDAATDSAPDASATVPRLPARAPAEETNSEL